MSRNLGERRWRQWIALCALTTAAWTPLPVAAQSYLGRYCFTATVTQRDTSPVSESLPFQYEAASLGGGMYALAGKTIGTGEPFLIAGIAQLIGQELIGNLATTLRDEDGSRDTGVAQFRLNVSTLTGSFFEVGNDFNPSSGQFSRRYSAGTLVATACS